MLRRPFRIGIEYFLPPVPIPRVTSPAFDLDFGQRPLLHAVASAEKWLAGFEVIKAGPHRRRLCVLDHDHVESLWPILVRSMLRPNAGESVPRVPGRRA